ncbi:hypothetical protein CJI59_07985 [Streptomyces sp. Alain-F2R5]|nr:hypothetical protein [Streptomyces sp. Alain-F2R5]PAN02047.1 hypothetical protein CJI59_07985 [Streptomyces sp. Alain-F2R5]
MIRPEVDWRELRTAAPGRRSPLSGLTPTADGRDTVLMTGIARIAGVGRATVANWRRRHTDFPAPAQGTATHPEFDRPAAVAWLLAHDKITVPSSVPSATLELRADGTGRGLRCRLVDPWLQLATDAADDDRISGWTNDQDADDLAALTAEGQGAAVRRLTAPGTVPLTVLGGARVIDRSRRGAGALRVTVSWPGALHGHLAPGRAGGPVRHGVPHTAPGPECRCAPDLPRHPPHALLPRARVRRGTSDGVAPRRGGIRHQRCRALKRPDGGGRGSGARPESET